MSHPITHRAVAGGSLLSVAGVHMSEKEPTVREMWRWARDRIDRA